MNYDMDQVHKALLRMADLVERAIHQTVDALCNRNPTQAQEVMAVEDDIDDLENRIDEECFRILALHQPVACDLRRIVAISTITSDLERMGDLSYSIAERTLALVRLPLIPTPADLQYMTGLTVDMVHGSLEAFVRLDAAQARRIILQDDEVDRLNCQIIQEVLAIMHQGPDLIEPGLSMFSAVRHLERIADYATNIAENAIYLVEGQIVRHHPEALSLPRPGAAAG